jgi:DNA-binding CsgD family transcriptional regulator
MQLTHDGLSLAFLVNFSRLGLLIMFSPINQHPIASIKSSSFESGVTNNLAIQVSLLEAVIESFVDGILILTSEYELIHINEYARQICQKLTVSSNKNYMIPEEILHICESLLDSREIFENENIFMEYEIDKGEAVKLRIRARWLRMENGQNDRILVTLEDCYLSNHNCAIADAKRYGLTEREAEVWLLRRSNLSYREIAQRLYITINTVKKHLKNIYAKQQGVLCLGS